MTNALRLIISIITILFCINTDAEEYTQFYSRYMNCPSEKLLQIGNSYINQPNKTDSALICFSIVANRISDNMPNHEKKLAMNGYIGRWYIYFFEYFNYEKSYENLLHAKQIAEDIGCGLAHIDLNFGCMYQAVAEQSNNIQMKEEALEFYRKAFAESIQENDSNSFHMAFSNMVFLSSDINKMDSIYKEFNIYSSIKSSAGNPDNDYSINMYKGLKSFNAGKYKEALRIFNRQKDSTKWTDDKARYLYIVHNNISRTQAAMQCPKEAITEMLAAEKLADRYKMKDARLEAYRLLAQYYNETGEKTKMEYYRNKYFQLKDTLLNYNQAVQFSKLKFMDQINEMDRQMAEISRRHQLQARLFYAGLGVSAVITLLAVMLYLKNKQLKRSNEHLYQNSIASLQREKIEREMRINYEQALKENMAASQQSERYSSSGLNEKDKETLMNKILTVMQTSEEIFSPEFKSDRLVELVGSNNRYVSQVINEKLGCTFTTLLGEYRIKEVCKRMNNINEYGNLTVNAIASSVGFRSHSGFYNTFKKVTGLSPAQYQKLARENVKN